MKTLFILPSDQFRIFHFGIASISSYLKKEGHQSKVFQFLIKGRIENHFKDILKELEKENPDLVAFTSYGTQNVWTDKLLKLVRKKGFKTIIGGYDATLNPGNYLETADFVCVGEGEKPLSELLAAMNKNKSPSKIKNLWMKRNNKIIKNQVRPLIENLDELPFPDREAFDYQEVIDSNNGACVFMASRGCPFQCTYCSNVALREKYPNKSKYLRFRSVDNFLEEIEEVTSKYDVKELVFHDDTLTIQKEWLTEFCEKYKKRFKYRFVCNARVEQCSVELLLMLKDAGCYMLSIGVESGDEKIRKKVMSRMMTDKQIEDAFKNARKVGLATYAFNMIGIPGETKKEIKKTFLFNMKLRPDAAQLCIFYPLKGTPLGDLCYEKGWVDKKALGEITSYVEGSVLNLPTITKKEVERLYRQWGFLLNAYLSFRRNFNHRFPLKVFRKIKYKLNKK